jgi:hypothetical protein
MMNEGWSKLEAPRLAISAWGLPESNFDRARNVWRGDISVSEPCAKPSRRIDVAPISIEASVRWRTRRYSISETKYLPASATPSFCLRYR